MSAKKPPRMARARMEVYTDILLILAELPSEDDATAVLEALQHLKANFHLRAMFQPCELPATTRRDLCERMLIDKRAWHPAYDNPVIIRAVAGDEARVEHTPSCYATVLLGDLKLVSS